TTSSRGGGPSLDPTRVSRVRYSKKRTGRAGVAERPLSYLPQIPVAAALGGLGRVRAPGTEVAPSAGGEGPMNAFEIVALVLLGFIALAQVFQSFIALRMAQSGARAMERFESISAQLEAEIQPQMAQLARITKEVEDLTRRATEQWPVVESALQ